MLQWDQQHYVQHPPDTSIENSTSLWQAILKISASVSKLALGTEYSHFRDVFYFFVFHLFTAHIHHHLHCWDVLELELWDQLLKLGKRWKDSFTMPRVHKWVKETYLLFDMTNCTKANRVMKDSFASAWEILATGIYRDTIQIIFGCFLRYRTQCLQAITIETQVLHFPLCCYLMRNKKKVKLVMDSWPVCIGTLLGDHHAIFVFTSNMRDHSYKTVTALVTVLRQLNLNYAEW